MRRVRLLTLGFEGARPFGRAPILLLLVLMLGACGATGGGSSAGSPSPVPSATAPDVLTEADNGASYRLPAGAEVHLRLSNRYIWSAPRATGPVELVQIEFFRDPGYSEWVIRPAGSGEATIRSTGTPNCKPGFPCPTGPLAFSVTLGL